MALLVLEETVPQWLERRALIAHDLPIVRTRTRTNSPITKSILVVQYNLKCQSFPPLCSAWDLQLQSIEIMLPHDICTCVFPLVSTQY